MDDENKRYSLGLAGCIALAAPPVVIIAGSVAAALYSGEAWVGLAIFAVLSGMTALLWVAALIQSAGGDER